jgi:spore maturation protein CgeB
MHWILFYHSLLSDWNHGNAHFLRGIVRELRARGERVTVYEPADGWSRRQLREQHGEDALRVIEEATGMAGVARLYTLETLDLDRALADADVVLAHEWNPPELIARLGRYRASHPALRLLFHDTHHRAVSAPEAMRAFDFTGFDGALVFGQRLREVYEAEGWCPRVWVWHEAADVTLFHPHQRGNGPVGDLVWIGNWGDSERGAELQHFLFGPARELSLRGTVRGVRYPPEALAAVEAAGLRYDGWLPNHRVPEVFARHAFTVHVPRRWYVEALPGIPTIRPFEALACGIPLICSPWQDTEGLFTVGEDFLMVENGDDMIAAMHALLTDAALGHRLASHGRRTIEERHTCAHRVDELQAIVASLEGVPAAAEDASRPAPEFCTPFRKR